MKTTKAQLERENAELREQLEQARVHNDHLRAFAGEASELRSRVRDLESDVDRLRHLRVKAFGKEPRVFSIVIDEDGFAWQRFDRGGPDGWYLAAAACDNEAGEAMPWNELNLRYGPVKVLHEAAEQEETLFAAAARVQEPPTGVERQLAEIDRLSRVIEHTADVLINKSQGGQ